MDYRKTAQEIYEKVGKKENLISAAHCATRLRLVLADNAKCDAKAVEDIEGVKGVFSASGQLQIILGTGRRSRPPPPPNSPCSSGPSSAWETSSFPSFPPLWPAAF